MTGLSTRGGRDEALVVALFPEPGTLEDWLETLDWEADLPLGVPPLLHVRPRVDPELVPLVPEPGTIVDLVAALDWEAGLPPPVDGVAVVLDDAGRGGLSEEPVVLVDPGRALWEELGVEPLLVELELGVEPLLVVGGIADAGDGALATRLGAL